MTAPLTIDLRSDTVTLPTEQMYEAMRCAPLGDDGLDGDPTVCKLEALAAHTLGKDAGLLTASATMANLLAVLSQAGRGQQVVLEERSHLYLAERGAATLSNTFFQGIAGVDGAMDLSLLEDTLHGNRARLRTALICMESSHNNSGGSVLPLAHMQGVRELAAQHDVPVHVDGARLFNAAIALNVPPAQIALHADTVTLCFSKGLSAPVGAMLVGPRTTIDEARKLRKMLGGQMRQAGVLAAAAMVGLQFMVPRLAEDHLRATRLSQAVNALRLGLSAAVPRTNIVQIEIAATGVSSAAWTSALRAEGIGVRPLGPFLLRCVLHRHVDDTAIEQAVRAFAQCASRLSARESNNLAI